MSRRLPPHRFRRALQAGLPVQRRAPEPDDAPAETWVFTPDSLGRRASGPTPSAPSRLPAEGAAFGWTGREYVADPGLQYNRARHVDDSAGRWLSGDPELFAAGEEEASGRS